MDLGPQFNLLSVIRPKETPYKWKNLFNEIEKTFYAEEYASSTFSTQASSSDPKPDVILMQLQQINNVDFSESGLKKCMLQTLNLLMKYTRSHDGALYIIINNHMQRLIRSGDGFSHGMKILIVKGTTLAAYVADTGKYVCVNHINNITEDGRFPYGCTKYSNYLDQSPKCIMGIPTVNSKGNVIAVYELVRFEDENGNYVAYNEPELEYALGFATSMGKALSNKYKRVNSKQWSFEFHDILLENFNQYSAEDNDCENLVSQILIKTRDYIKATRIWYYVPINFQKREAYLFEEGLVKGSKMFKKKFPIEVQNGGVVTYVWENNQYVIASGDKLNNFKIVDSDLDSVLCVPIGSKDKVIGIIKVINKYNDVFTAKDAIVLRQSGLYCALAFKHYLAKRDYELLDNMFEELKKSVLYFTLNCDHENETFLKALKEIELPPDAESITWFPKEEEIQYIDVYTWIFVKKFCYNEPLFKKFPQFLLAIKHCYRRLPYHNFEHAFLVFHTVCVILLLCKDKFSQFEINCFLIASLCHDIDHPGTSNDFLKFSEHPLAQLYEENYLENHHSFITRMLIDHHKLFSSSPPEEYKKYIKEIHKLILATSIPEFENKALLLESLLHGNEYDDKLHRNLLKCMIMTVSDLSSPLKCFSTSQRFTTNAYEEYYAEAENYRNLGVDPIYYMTKDNCKCLPVEMLVFIKYLCERAANYLKQILPETEIIYTTFRERRKEWVSYKGDFCENLPKVGWTSSQSDICKYLTKEDVETSHTDMCRKNIKPYTGLL